MVNNKAAKITNYFKITQNKPPSLWLVEAVKLLKQTGNALDLGCGAGSDTKFLLEKGFKVTAVDINPETEKYIKKLLHQKNLNFVVSSFENFEFPKKEYDLINAFFSLPFTNRDVFDEVFIKMKKSLKPEGIFVGQLFGVNDDWAKLPTAKTTFHTKKEAKQLFKDWKLIRFVEQDRDGTLADGTPKHWHSFHIMAEIKG